jgi:hypothetical protein
MKEINIKLNENTHAVSLTMKGGWTVAEWEGTLGGLMHNLLEEAINIFSESEEAKKLSKDKLEKKIEETKILIAAEVASMIIDGDEGKIEIERVDKKDLFTF